MNRLGTGIGWRPEIADAVERMPGIDWVEAVAENVCPGHLPESLLRLRERGVTVVPHGVSLGLGGADRPDEARLGALAERARALGSPLVTEHIAFVRAGGPLTASPLLEAGHLLPVPRTRDALDVLCENIRIAQDALPVPLAVENIAALISWPGEEMTEGQFLYELVERTGVRLLIDVANLHTNHVNRGEDPARALDELPVEAIAYVHVAGGFERDGVWHDSHAHPVPQPVLDILTDLASRTTPPGVLLERDDNFPEPAELERELATVRETVEKATSQTGTWPTAPGPTASRRSDATARSAGRGTADMAARPAGRGAAGAAAQTSATPTADRANQPTGSQGTDPANQPTGSQGTDPANQPTGSQGTDPANQPARSQGTDAAAQPPRLQATNLTDRPALSAPAGPTEQPADHQAADATTHPPGTPAADTAPPRAATRTTGEAAPTSATRTTGAAAQPPRSQATNLTDQPALSAPAGPTERPADHQAADATTHPPGTPAADTAPPRAATRTTGEAAPTSASRAADPAAQPADPEAAGVSRQSADWQAAAPADRPATPQSAGNPSRPADPQAPAPIDPPATPSSADPEGSGSGSASVRQRVGIAQAALLSSLVAGTPVPEGFDRVRLGVQARALGAKRAGVVAKVAPELPEILGEEYRPAFFAYAHGHPMTGGYRRDALDFAEHLLLAGRPEDAEARRRLRDWWLERSGPTPPSRHPAARLARATRRVLLRH